MSHRQKSSGQESRRVSRCRKCDALLPLRLSGDKEQAAAWVCASCETAFVGVFDNGASADTYGSARLRPDYFVQGWADGVPSGLRQFVDKLPASTQFYDGEDRRDALRFDKPAVVSVAPLNTLYTPIGESYSVMTRNFSHAGLALIHTRAIDDEFIAVALSPDRTSQIQIIARVTWCQPLKRFYEIGGEFVARLGG